MFRGLDFLQGMVCTGYLFGLANTANSALSSLGMIVTQLCN
jgi:hypothetical protein